MTNATHTPTANRGPGHLYAKIMARDAEIDRLKAVNADLFAALKDAAIICWRAANPDAATEVEIARRSRIMVEQLRAMSIALPPDFEARLLARCQEDRSLLDLLDLGLAKGGRVLLDLLDLFFAFLPMPPPRADSAAGAR